MFSVQAMDASKCQVFIFATILVILASLCEYGEAYTAVIQPDPSHPGKCMYRGEEVKAGVSAGPLPCQRLTCQKDGSVLVEGCGKIRLENCNRGERLNLDKPYPECCKQRFKCKRPDGSSYYEEKDIF